MDEHTPPTSTASLLASTRRRENITLSAITHLKQSFWVAAEIAAQPNVKAIVPFLRRFSNIVQDQTKLIIKFLNVANLCLLMNNLFSVFAIVGALGFPDVRIVLLSPWVITRDGRCGS